MQKVSGTANLSGTGSHSKVVPDLNQPTLSAAQSMEQISRLLNVTGVTLPLE